MKKLLLATLAVVAMSAQAAVVTSDFNVSVTLNARCVATNSGNVTLNFGTYDAIDGGAGTPAPTGALTFNCTRGLAAPTLSFDVDAAPNATTAGNPSYGVIAGLNYSVSTPASAVITAGTPATAAAAPGGLGTPDAYSYTLTGAMASGQAGACGGGNATACTPATTTVTRTLTLTY